MIFKNKLDRILNIKKEQENITQNIELEKNDLLALLISGFIILIPALLFVIVIFSSLFLIFLH
ncbi:hypothetical protein JYG23_08380 [Sedimentibacter sp. zth1]|uniref:hypothetical protein n=1 Tax=Sedimentibacter sp. zth1 TaxID=2816908 RepID=UPI001A90E9FF|nr:hypothetical protein [Sedimentibacter sp. zth1]QSX04724.1 hypothetical protein JYG23_08380 [Sedimentibacter sp. zth1]